MAYETFAGKDATGATVSWIGDQLAGGFVLVCKLDAGGDGVSAPVTAATPLPVTQPLVTNAAPMPVRDAPNGDPLNVSGLVASPTTSQQIVAQNLSRRIIEISNANVSGVWIRFGAGNAVVGQGTYLPSKATGYWITTARAACIIETGGTAAANLIGFTEW